MKLRAKADLGERWRGWRQQIFDRMCGRWLAYYRERHPKLREAVDCVGRHVGCPCHEGKTQSNFRLFPDAEITGGGVCNTCGKFGSGYKLLKWLMGWDIRQVWDDLGRWLSLPPPNAEEAKASHQAYQQEAAAHPGKNGTADKRDGRADLKKLKRLLGIYNGCQDDNGRVARYLRSRGLSGTVPPGLGYHPGIEYWHGDESVGPISLGRFGCMVAVVRPVKGRGVNLHKTYLSDSGDGKANVPSPKKFMSPIFRGAMSGCAIQLYPAEGEALSLTEGIETGVAVHEATGLPVWAAATADLLARVKVPDHVKRVYLWADNDDSGVGQEAGRKAAARLLAQGKEVFLLVPPKAGTDWLDILREDGDGALRQAREQAEPCARNNPPNGNDGASEFGDHDPINLTDRGNAIRAARRYRQCLRYCHVWDQWWVWDGDCWREDRTGESVLLCKRVLVDLRREAYEDIERATTEGGEGDGN